MATSKTLTPTNVVISIPEFTDQPDQRVNSNCLDKEADAINALNTNKMNGTVAEFSNLSVFSDSSHRRLILRGNYPNADYLQAVFFGDTKEIQIMKSVGGTETALATFVDITTCVIVETVSVTFGDNGLGIVNPKTNYRPIQAYVYNGVDVGISWSPGQSKWYMTSSSYKNVTLNVVITWIRAAS